MWPFSRTAELAPMASASSAGARRSRRRVRRGQQEVVFPMTGVMPRMNISEAVAGVVLKRRSTFTNSGWLTTNNVSFTAGSYTFIPSTIIPDFAQLAAVFDQYRIVKIQAWFVPRTTTSTSNATNLGQAVSVVDYDDGASLGSFAAGTEYENSLIGPGNCGHYREFKPHIALAAYQGTFVGFANVSDEWIDASYGTVQYFGLKVGVSATDSAYVWDLECRVHSEWRNAR